METAESKPTVQKSWLPGAQASGIDAGVSHACLSNLVIFTETADDLPVLNEVIGEFVLKHPCRVIVVHAQPRHPESKLEIDYNPHTFTSDSGKRGICDQITIKATGASVRETPARCSRCSCRTCRSMSGGAACFCSSARWSSRC